MKKTLILACLLSLAWSGHARQLTPEEALRRVDHNIASRSVSPRLCLTVADPADPSFNGAFIFNTDHGFIVVSADDAAPPVLGYGDEMIQDTSELPPAMVFWLERFASQIREEAATRSFGREGADSSHWIDVEPLVTSKWEQTEPYNAMTPEKGGQHAYTGCVATAISQVMRYHAYPASGEGDISYSYDSSSYISGTYSMDFSAVSFDYSKMPDTCSPNAPAENRDAVALLCYASGLAVNMWYSLSYSGSWSDLIAPALYNYFSYSPSLYKPEEDYFTQSQWEEMIYNQLSQGLPIIYGGTSASFGHSWICDGYKKTDQGNMFHFNWGWGGRGDGYYLVTNLYPSNTSSAFNREIEMVVNIATPDTKIDNLEKYPLIISTGEFNAPDITTTKSQTVSLGSKSPAFFTGTVTNLSTNMNNGLKNTTARSLKGSPGLLITNNATGQRILTYARLTNFKPPTYRAGFNPNVISNLSPVIPENIPEGTYTVVPVFKPEDNDLVRVRISLGLNDAMTMTVKGHDASFVMTGLRPVLTRLTSPEISSESLSFNLSVYNPSSRIVETSPGIRLISLDGTTAYPLSCDTLLSLKAKKEISSSLRATFTSEIEAGNYYLEIYDKETGIPFTVGNTLSDNIITISKTEAGIDTIFDNENRDASSTVYYDLNGLKVSNPQAGHIYIRRKGSESKKIIYNPSMP